MILSNTSRTLLHLLVLLSHLEIVYERPSRAEYTPARQRPTNGIISRPIIARTPPAYQVQRIPADYYRGERIRGVDFVDREEILVQESPYDVYGEEEVVEYPYAPYEIVDQRYERPIREQVIVRNGLEYGSPHLSTPARMRTQDVDYRDIAVTTTPRYVSMRQPQTEPRIRYSMGYPPTYPASTSKLSARKSIGKKPVYESEPFEEYAHLERRKSKGKPKPKVSRKEEIVETPEDDSVEVTEEEEEDAPPIRKRLGMARIPPKHDSQEGDRRQSVNKVQTEAKKQPKVRKSVSKSSEVTKELHPPEVEKENKIEETPAITTEAANEIEIKNEVEPSLTLPDEGTGTLIFDAPPAMDDDFPEPNPLEYNNGGGLDEQQVISDYLATPLEEAPGQETEQTIKKPKKKRVRKETVTAKKVKKETFDFKDYLKDDDQLDDGSRKSKRTRIAPVAFWKNEKVVYGRRESGFGPIKAVIQDVIRVPSDDEAPIKPKARTKVRVKKEELPPIPEKIEVINYLTKQEETQSNGIANQKLLSLRRC
jgi:hypothetical protein